jgi:hypothetical protein
MSRNSGFSDFDGEARNTRIDGKILITPRRLYGGGKLREA